MPRIFSVFLRRLQGFFQSLLQRLPRSTRDRLDDAVHDVIARHVTSSVRVKGPLIGSELLLTCMLLGQPLHSRYFLPRTFAHGNNPQFHQAQLLFSPLKTLLEKPPKDTDLLILRVPNHRLPSITGLYDYHGRSHVKQVIDVSTTWEDIRHRWHSNAKDTERKIRKFGFRSQVSHSLHDFQFFYHEMYVPHIRQQFGTLADIIPYENLLRNFNQGFLLFLNYNEQRVAATLCETEGDIFTYRCMGMSASAGHETNAAKQAARAALYYFMLRLAKDWDMKQVDLLTSLALLHDGVYVHKRKWGSVVQEEKTQTSVCFRILRYSEAVIQFFELNPVIITTDKGLQGLIGWPAPHAPSALERAELFHKYYTPGLAGLLLLTPGLATPLEIPFSQQPVTSQVQADTSGATLLVSS